MDIKATKNLIGSWTLAGYKRWHKKLGAELYGCDGDFFLVDFLTDKVLCYFCVCANFSRVTTSEKIVVRDLRRKGIPTYVKAFKPPESWRALETDADDDEVADPMPLYVYKYDDYLNGRRNFKKFETNIGYAEWEVQLRRKLHDYHSSSGKSILQR